MVAIGFCGSVAEGTTRSGFLKDLLIDIGGLVPLFEAAPCGGRGELFQGDRRIAHIHTGITGLIVGGGLLREEGAVIDGSGAELSRGRDGQKRHGEERKPRRGRGGGESRRRSPGPRRRSLGSRRGAWPAERFHHV